MKKLLYYRLGHQDCELLTDEQAQRLSKLWVTDFDKIDSIEEDQNYGTGVLSVTNILAVIQCNKSLNKRFEALTQRLATKKITPSKNTYIGKSSTVEAGILVKIIEDSLRVFNGIDYHKIPFKEFYRLMNIPYQSILREVDKQYSTLEDIEDPKTNHKVNFTYPKSNSIQSCVREYAVKGKLVPKIKNGSLQGFYHKFRFAEKLYQMDDLINNESYIEIRVRDLADRDWAFQTIIDYLIKNKLIILQ